MLLTPTRSIVYGPDPAGIVAEKSYTPTCPDASEVGTLSALVALASLCKVVVARSFPDGPFTITCVPSTAPPQIPPPPPSALNTVAAACVPPMTCPCTAWVLGPPPPHAVNARAAASATLMTSLRIPLHLPRKIVPQHPGGLSGAGLEPALSNGLSSTRNLSSDGRGTATHSYANYGIRSRRT